MSLLLSARFHTTVAQTRQLSRGNIPELAFVGRSNAGKSSAINILCQRRKLAFASNTPGRTQALNFFAVGPDPLVSAYLVDMPGYGYAVAERTAREEWGALSGRYLSSRKQLVGVVLIIDIRRGLGPLDLKLLDCLSDHHELLVLASKADKLNRQQQALAIASLQSALVAARGSAPSQVLAFSATAGTGVQAARVFIEELLARSQPEVAPSEPTVAGLAN